MMVEILGDGKRKRRYNPDLANQVNAEYERAKAKDKGLRETKPEEAVEDISRGDYTVASMILNTYKRALEEGIGYENYFRDLAAKQIEFFSRKLIDFKDHDDFETVTGDYLTYLMKNSKDSQFEFYFNDLNSAGKKLIHLGYRLRDKKVFIHGDVGNRLGEQARDCGFYLKTGSAEDFMGFGAYSCRFKVEEDVGKEMGAEAVKTIFKIKRHLGEHVDEIKKRFGQDTMLYRHLDGWVKV